MKSQKPQARRRSFVDPTSPVASTVTAIAGH